MDHKTEARYGLGIDPGWKNLGMAIVKEIDGQIILVQSQTLNPSELGLSGTVREIYLALSRHFNPDRKEDTHWPPRVSIERFVSYNNVLTAESENILMLIGAISYFFGTKFYGDTEYVDLYRAIDWKQDLVKLLVKNRGFDNPSTSLDKKFSIAAAHACLDTPGEFNTDHEADAICLASIGFLKDRYTKTVKPKNIPSA